MGRSPGEGKGYPLQYSGLENSMDCTVHEVAKSWIQLSDFHFSFFGFLLSLLPSTYSHHQPVLLPTPVFWPGEFHGLYSPRGCKELDTTERLSFFFLWIPSVFTSFYFLPPSASFFLLVFFLQIRYLWQHYVLNILTKACYKY